MRLGKNHYRCTMQDRILIPGQINEDSPTGYVAYALDYIGTFAAFMFTFTLHCLTVNHASLLRAYMPDLFLIGPVARLLTIIMVCTPNCTL